MATLKVLNGYTLDVIETTMYDYNDDNIIKVAKQYEKEHGKLIDIIYGKDVVVGKYANGMVLGFSAQHHPCCQERNEIQNFLTI